MERKELRIKAQPENKKTKQEKEHDGMRTTMMYEMTINSILNPLLDILYEYKASDGYNYVPGTKEDPHAGWDYYGKRFQSIFKALHANIFLSEKQYRFIHSIIEGLFSFVRKFEYADGLPDLFLQANEKLNFYLLAFTVPESQRALFREKLNGMPTDEELSVADHYHASLRQKNEKLNLQLDTDDFFVDELAYAVRQLFQIALNA